MKSRKKQYVVGCPAGISLELSPPVVDRAPPTKCTKCGSAKRGPYYARHVQVYGGVLPDGRKYGRIVRQRCRCIQCGQVRIDRSYEA
jgi:hypothetical protein